ncbi:MAG TPA: fibronectin type III domain-containing protein, partial [Candidatus Hydrogenedentes bacterium]|nr:fibronectin type III domain-containing protein [Candidatus Hydrogenedentota bacterium]
MEKRGYFGAVVFLTMGVVLGSGLPAAGLELLVKPYLNYPTTDSIVVRWETDVPASSLVRWGSAVPLEKTAAAEGAHTLHEVTLDGLESGAPYFYQVCSRDDAGNEVESDVYTFGTAVEGGAAFGFVVFCDTQSNPEGLRRLAEFAYAQRPAFTLIGGDLVSDGTVKEQWTGHF